MNTLLQWLAGAFLRLAENIRLVAEDFVNWFWGLLWSALQVFLDNIGLPQLPSSSYMSSLWSACAPYFQHANLWVPLQEGVAMLTAYIAFYVVFVPIRVIIRHLPMVGG